MLSKLLIPWKGFVGLSATPGTDIKAVQAVVQKLNIRFVALVSSLELGCRACHDLTLAIAQSNRMQD